MNSAALLHVPDPQSLAVSAPAVDVSATESLGNQPSLVPVADLADVSALTGRITELEDQLQGQSSRMADLEHSLHCLVSRIRRTGGYSSSEDQQALWEAERILAEERPWPLPAEVPRERQGLPTAFAGIYTSGRVAWGRPP